VEDQFDNLEVADGIGEVMVLDASTALMAADRAQIDSQVATAKQYPRSVTGAIRKATELATLDQATAASCLYCLPRSGKKIEGPSVRMAEIIAHAWTNMRVQAEVTAIDEKFLTATATAMDLEANVGFRMSVKRRITDRHGKRFNEDMIVVTSNAACSIASRNVVFKVVPKALWEPVYQRARRASIGKRETIQEQRKTALDWFSKKGMSNAQVFEMLGVKGSDDIGMDELITLLGTKTAIEEGDTTVEFLTAKGIAQSDGAQQLNAALKNDAIQA